MCATFGSTGFPSFSGAGEGSQKPLSGRESSWQGTIQPRAVPGQLVFPPQDYRGFKQMLNARCSPEETSSGGVFILKPMDPNLLGFFHAQSPGLAPSTPQLNHSL